MNQNILTQKVDIAEAVFEKIEMSLPDDSADCYAVLQEVKQFLRQDLYFDLEMAISIRVSEALEAGFKAGWQMRGQV